MWDLLYTLPAIYYLHDLYEKCYEITMGDLSCTLPTMHVCDVTPYVTVCSLVCVSSGSPICVPSGLPVRVPSGLPEVLLKLSGGGEK